MDREALKTKLIDTLIERMREVEKVEVLRSSITPETALSDFGVDSLAFIEALNEFEEQNGVEVPFSANDRRSIRTVADLMALIDEIPEAP